MWTAQDYALVISTLTGLLALGVPPIVSALDARRARRAAQREEMERLLFFVLDRHHQQAANFHRWSLDLIRAAQRKEPLPGSDALEAALVEGFWQSFARLKALAALHRIDDAGFSAAVDHYLALLPPMSPRLNFDRGPYGVRGRP